MLPEEKDPSDSIEKISRISINLGNERVFVKLDDIFYAEKAGRYTLINCLNGKFKLRQTLQEMGKYLGPKFYRSHKSFIINIDRIDRIVSFQNSSCYEVRFVNCKETALLSRDRLHELMDYIPVLDL